MSASAKWNADTKTMSAEARQLRLEQCRIEVRSYLYDRGMGIAQSAAMIQRTLRRHWDFTDEEVKAACLFWTGEEQFEEVRDPAGATRHYKITAEGVKAHEASLV